MPKPLSSLAHLELVSAMIYTFRLPFLSLSMKERKCGYCMHYVGAVPKGNWSYGTMELTALFSLMTVSTNWLRILKTTSLRSSCGLLSIRTRPPVRIVSASEPSVQGRPRGTSERRCFHIPPTSHDLPKRTGASENQISHNHDIYLESAS